MTGNMPLVPLIVMTSPIWFTLLVVVAFMIAFIFTIANKELRKLVLNIYDIKDKGFKEWLKGE